MRLRTSAGRSALRPSVIKVFFFVLLCGCEAFTRGPTVTVDDLGWLKGCWASNSEGREISEHWMKPSGRTMLGMSRTVAGGKTVEFEFIQIRQEDSGDIFYVARPSRQAEASFRLVKSGRREAVFENPDHDFPQKIIYRLEADGSLFARIEGVSKGRQRGLDFLMKREPCE